jgi:hypothetical protein
VRLARWVWAALLWGACAHGPERVRPASIEQEPASAGPTTVRPVPVWLEKESLGWGGCAVGSTLVERRTPGEGREPYVVRRTVVESNRVLVKLANEGPDGKARSSGHFLTPLQRSAAAERLLRRDSLVVEGESVPVEVFERVDRPEWYCDSLCPCRGDILREEVWRRVGAPSTEEPLRVRYDRVHSVLRGSCTRPPSSLREPDAEGFVDTRRVLRLRAEAVIDGRVHACLEVRTWNHEDLPLDALECPSVFGGRARWEEPRHRDGQPSKDLVEVVSFDCRRP